MKRKFAIFFVLVLCCMVAVTGCNLFTTDNYRGLDSIVAESGSVKITREQFINSYASTGYTYTSYGYSREQAVKLTIDQLINQEYLLRAIDKSEDENVKLNSTDYCKAVQQTFERIDSDLETYIKEVRVDFGLKTEDLESETEEEEPEFALQESYKTKFEKIGDKIYLKEEEEDDEIEIKENFKDEKEAKEFAVKNYDYLKRIKSKSKDYKILVWKKYLSNLKSAQSRYGYKDLSDEAVVKRRIEEVFDTNLKSIKISKFQDSLKTGFAYDEEEKRYYVNENTLQKILDAYKENYNQNYSLFGAAPSYLRNGVAGADSSNSDNKRENYVYFGNDGENGETFITCTHVLIKLSQEQLDLINTYKTASGENEAWKGEALDAKLKEIKSQENTMCSERDLETGKETGVEISVEELYNKIKTDIDDLTDKSIENIVKVFDKYVYSYNVDTGILNAKYDYVVGTKTSAMVQSFTDAVRDLYENGKVGDISQPILEENDNYTGYHIILYTGTLQNIFESDTEMNEKLNLSNLYNYLSRVKTSISYNETLFEYFFDNVVGDDSTTELSNFIAKEKNGVDTKYINSNFSDFLG